MSRRASYRQPALFPPPEEARPPAAPEPDDDAILGQLWRGPEDEPPPPPTEGPAAITATVAYATNRTFTYTPRAQPWRRPVVAWWTQERST